MELRDIEYFAVVAEHGNVRRAAEALDLSPPALSMSLRRLEKAIGAKLVLRTPKGVELTPVGSALLAQAHRIRLTLDDVKREAADLGNGRAGLLRVASSPVISMDLPAAYVVLAKEAPALKLHVVTADNDVSLPMLVKGELDLVLNYLPHADSVSLTHVPVGALEHEHLYDDLVVVFASVKHRLAGQKRVTMADLVQERWAANQTLTALRQLSRAFQERGFAPPQIAFEARSAHLRLQAVAGSSLLGHLSRAIVQDPQGQTRISCNDFTA